MNNLQLRYLRNCLTVWVIVAGIYFAFWWIIPIHPQLIPIVYLVGVFIYGLWFFR